MIQANPASLFDAVLALGAGHSGLVGTLEIQIVDPGTTTVILAPTKIGINEDPAGSGIYGVELRAPLPPGLYGILWDWANGAQLSPSNSSPDTLQVTIKEPMFPGGWSWSPWGWFWPAEDELSNEPAGTNAIPTAADVRASSKLDFTELGYRKHQDQLPGGLQEVVDRGESMFWRITGQTIDELDVRVYPMVQRVVMGLTEQVAMQGSADVLDTQSDWDLIQGFGAGPYNETHRDPGEARKAWMLNPVPWISDALWSLLTQERYEFYWHFFSGSNIPAFANTDVFWQDGIALGNLYGPNYGFYWGS